MAKDVRPAANAGSSVAFEADDAAAGHGLARAERSDDQILDTRPEVGLTRASERPLPRLDGLDRRADGTISASEGVGSSAYERIDFDEKTP